MAKIEPGMLCILKDCLTAQNNGKIVTAIKMEHGPLLMTDGKMVNKTYWFVDKELSCWTGKTTRIAMPYNLIPITPPDTDKFVLDEIIKELCNA